MNGFFHSHVFWVGLYAVVKFVFDAAVSSMDAPGVNDAPVSARYRYWFKFLNRCAANLQRANAATGNGNGQPK